MERFLLGVYTMVPPAEVTNRCAADTGLDAAPDPPLTEAEFERVVSGARQALLVVMRDRKKAKAAEEKQAREARRPALRGALSDRAELMLGLVRESTEFDGVELTRYFCPKNRPMPMLYGRALPYPGFRPCGAGDVAILRSLVRRGLIREVRGPIEFSYAVTPEGMAAYDEIKERRASLPEPVAEVDDEP